MTPISARIIRLLAALAGIPPQMMRQRTLADDRPPIPLHEGFPQRVLEWLGEPEGSSTTRADMHHALSSAVMMLVPLTMPSSASPLASRMHVRIAATLDVVLDMPSARKVVFVPPAPPSVITEVQRDMARMPRPAPIPQRDHLAAITIHHVIAAHLAGVEVALSDVLAAVRTSADAAWLCRVGFVHPTIWEMVTRDGAASLDLLLAGWTDPSLYPSIHPFHVSALLRRRPDLQSVAFFFALASRHERSAADVVIHIPEARHLSSLIETAAQSAEMAGEVLRAVPELRTNDRLIAAALADPAVAVGLLDSLPELQLHPAMQQIRMDDPTLACAVLRAVPHACVHPSWIRAAARDARVACDLLIACPHLRDQRDLITAAARSPWTACDVVTTVEDLADHPTLLAAVATQPHAARTALVRRPALLRHAILVHAVAKQSEAAWDVVVKVPAARHEYLLMTTLARSAADAGMLLCAFPEVRTMEWLIQRASDDPMVVQMVTEQVPELRHHPRFAHRLITGATEGAHV